MNETAKLLVDKDLSTTRVNTPAQSELMSYRITPETPLPPMEPLFTMFGVPCFYRGELVAACGKAKSGKTTFLSVIMTAGIAEKCLALERNKGHTEKEESAEVKPLRVLWIDTEQSQQSTQDILVNRIVKMYDGEETARKENLNDCFFALNVRGIGYQKRRELTEAAITTIKPDLVIIDGIKDLVTDINDAVQATRIMEQLMALAQRSKCCIVNVLHQNKSETDRNMRGSIGTELTNKAFEVFQCEFLERHQMFKVSQTLSRRQRMKASLYYDLTKDSLPEICDAPPEQPRDDLGRWTSSRTVTPSAQFGKEQLRKLFTDAMEGRTQRPYNELMAVALKKCGVQNSQVYYDMLAEAEQQGIIRQTDHPETHKQWVELTDDGVLPF